MTQETQHSPKNLAALAKVVGEELSRNQGPVTIPFFGMLRRAEAGSKKTVHFSPDQTFLGSALDTADVLKVVSSVSIPYIDLSRTTVPKEVLGLIPEHIARQYFVVPVESKTDSVVVAMIDPDDHEALEVVKKKIGKPLDVRLATQADISHILDQYGEVESEIKEIVASADEEQEEARGKKPAKSKKIEEGEDFSEEAPAAKIVASLLKRAVREKASDIHIEPTETEVLARFRIDGVLHKVVTLPHSVRAGIISRVKVLSSLKIDEQRLPQDGRFQITLDQGKIDFRVSVFPTVNGEKVVMRILDTTAGVLTLEQLGLREAEMPTVKNAISKAHGMTLVTGPTGSGKSTTLYAVLKELMNEGVNIVTLEDPVEYKIPTINQSQVNSEINYTFALGLRSIVRQDPDIVMVGEIRDLESADLAIHAALTGHIVLSTLHTNDAAGAAPRLIDMGIEPFLITSSVNALMAQRLARKICADCKEKLGVGKEQVAFVRAELEKLPPKLKQTIKLDAINFYHGKGCQQCNNTGYRGRVGIFEILAVTEGIKELIVKRVSASAVKEKAQQEGMVTMMQDGYLKVIEGITTLEEVLRTTKE